MEPVLSVRDLRKVYPGSIKSSSPSTASPSIYIPGRSWTARLNGAGKTTTIQMLLSTLKPTSGAIVYFEKDFFKHRSNILKVVFASTYVSLPWMLTAAQNLEVFARLYGVPVKEIHPRMDILLERFGILDKKKHPIAQFSAGQITRLMLVKAFMVNPEIVLLDEPTARSTPTSPKRFASSCSNKNSTAAPRSSSPHTICPKSRKCGSRLIPPKWKDRRQ